LIFPREFRTRCISPRYSRLARRTVGIAGASLPRGAPAIPTVRLANREYRGEIHLVLNSRGKINVVNVLPMEDYLRGVVPLELSPSSYPEIEALKAQAIA